MDDRRVVDLPLNGRNVIALARILPAVLNVAAPQQKSDARGGPEMNVNSGCANMNLFTFNEDCFNKPSRNTNMNYPPLDAVQEVRILTHNFVTDPGRNPGLQVTVVSRAGASLPVTSIEPSAIFSRYACRSVSIPRFMATVP